MSLAFDIEVASRIAGSDAVSFVTVSEGQAIRTVITSALGFTAEVVGAWNDLVSWYMRKNGDVFTTTQLSFEDWVQRIRDLWETS